MSRRDVLASAASICVSLLARPARAVVQDVSVVVETAIGTIDLALECGRAPISSGDFLKYVDRRLFDGGAFYRTVRPDDDPGPVKIDVIQGGVTDEKKRLPPVIHEPTSRTGLRHRDGTVSLARRSPGTGSAAAFFICVGDQPELDFGGKRNPDGQGFAAFGRVVRGMDVVRTIWKLKTGGPLGSSLAQTIAHPVPILRVRRTL